MDNTIQRDRGIQHVLWSTGIVGGLLLISLGLELLAHQVFGRTDLGTLLWALYLSFWSFILGTTGLLLLIIRWLIAWRRVLAHVDEIADFVEKPAWTIARKGHQAPMR